MAGGIVSKAYGLITAEDDGRVCKDIPDEACHEQPRHFMIHVLSLSATKLGGGLSDPKLVLSWLLGVLAAPAWMIGVLVPIREAGALLPQLVIADWVRRRSQRKWVWALGSTLQGVAVLGMAAAGWLMEGAAAAWVIVSCLVVFSLARSFCSVSYKDVLGKTISKSTRGTTTGTAATIAAVLVFVYGLVLSTGLLPRNTTVILLGLAVAGALWLIAAGLFTTLDEKPGSTGGGGRPLDVVREQFGLLRDDKQLRWFILTRGLLTATALAPPYMVNLVGKDHSVTIGGLGLFVIASSLASVLSTYVWGRLSDKSSRKVLIAAGVGSTVVLLGAAMLAWLLPEVVGLVWVMPVVLFMLMLCYQGVRLGRATHLVDMADQDSRAAYTAISNTIIGVLLLLASAVGSVAHVLGMASVLVVFGAMSLLGALSATRLEEVQ